MVAFKLDHVDAVGGKAAHRLVKRRGHVADAKDERGHGRTAALFGPGLLARHDDKARRVVTGIFDIGAQDLQTVGLGGEARRDRGDGGIAVLGHLPGRACGVGMNLRLQAQFADELAALTQRMDVAVDGLEVRKRRPRHPQQVVIHALEVLGDDEQARRRQQVMNVGHPACQ